MWRKAISPPELRPTYFDGGEQAARLQALKEAIRIAYPDRIRSYTPHWESDGFTGFEALATQMIEDIVSTLSEQLPDTAPDSWQAETQQLQQRYAAARLRRFQGRDLLLDELTGLIRQGGARVMLTGNSGTGKKRAALQGRSVA